MNNHKHAAPWVTVMKRELVVRGLSKSYIIGTVVSLAIIVILSVVVTLVSQSSPEVIAVNDDDSAAVVTMMNESNVSSGKDPGYEVKQVSTRDEAESLVRDGDAGAALIHGDAEWTYLVKEYSSSTLTDKVTFSQAVSQYMQQMNANRLGFDMTALSQGSTLNATSLTDNDNANAPVGFIVGAIFAVLFVGAVLPYGLQIAQSVVEEKQSRIVEILISTISVKDLLMGKIFALSILAFIQILLYAGVGLMATSFTGLGEVAGLVGLSVGIGWFIVFFIAGFLSLSCVWAAAGAMATRQEDLGQTTMPLTMLVMATYVAGFFASGILQQILSYVPIVSSVLMPARVVIGQASWWEALISLVITLVFCFVAIRFGASIYRRGIMQTKVLKFKNLLSASSK